VAILISHLAQSVMEGCARPHLNQGLGDWLEFVALTVFWRRSHAAELYHARAGLYEFAALRRPTAQITITMGTTTPQPRAGRCVWQAADETAACAWYCARHGTSRVAIRA